MNGDKESASESGSVEDVSALENLVVVRNPLFHGSEKSPKKNGIAKKSKTVSPPKKDPSNVKKKESSSGKSHEQSKVGKIDVASIHQAQGNRVSEDGIHDSGSKSARSPARMDRAAASIRSRPRRSSVDHSTLSATSSSESLGGGSGIVMHSPRFEVYETSPRSPSSEEGTRKKKRDKSSHRSQKGSQTEAKEKGSTKKRSVSKDHSKLATSKSTPATSSVVGLLDGEGKKKKKKVSPHRKKPSGNKEKKTGRTRDRGTSQHKSKRRNPSGSAIVSPRTKACDWQVGNAEITSGSRNSVVYSSSPVSPRSLQRSSTATNRRGMQGEVYREQTAVHSASAGEIPKSPRAHMLPSPRGQSRGTMFGGVGGDHASPRRTQSSSIGSGGLRSVSSGTSLEATVSFEDIGDFGVAASYGKPVNLTPASNDSAEAKRKKKGSILKGLSKSVQPEGNAKAYDHSKKRSSFSHWGRSGSPSKNEKSPSEEDLVWGVGGAEARKRRASLTARISAESMPGPTLTQSARDLSRGKDKNRYLSAKRVGELLSELVLYRGTGLQSSLVLCDRIPKDFKSFPLKEGVGESLIRCLVSLRKYDAEYVKVIMYGYPYFCDAMFVLETLIAEWEFDIASEVERRKERKLKLDEEAEAELAERRATRKLIQQQREHARKLRKQKRAEKRALRKAEMDSSTRKELEGNHNHHLMANETKMNENHEVQVDAMRRAVADHSPRKGDDTTTASSDVSEKGNVSADEHDPVWYISKYSFSDPQHRETMLSFDKGERVALLKRVDSNWWYGRTSTRCGLFPSSYVKRIREHAQQDGSHASTPHGTPASAKNENLALRQKNSRSKSPNPQSSAKNNELRPIKSADQLGNTFSLEDVSSKFKSNMFDRFDSSDLSHSDASEFIVSLRLNPVGDISKEERAAHEKWQYQIRNRVMNVLEFWMAEMMDDFVNESLLAARLASFLEKVIEARLKKFEIHARAKVLRKRIRHIQEDGKKKMFSKSRSGSTTQLSERRSRLEEVSYQDLCSKQDVHTKSLLLDLATEIVEYEEEDILLTSKNSFGGLQAESSSDSMFGTDLAIAATFGTPVNIPEESPSDDIFSADSAIAATFGTPVQIPSEAPRSEKNSPSFGGVKAKPKSKRLLSKLKKKNSFENKRILTGSEITLRIMKLLGVSREPAQDVASRLLVDGHIILEGKGKADMLLRDNDTRYRVLDLEQLYPEVLLVENVDNLDTLLINTVKDLHPVEVARQLTLIESEYFRGIQARELTKRAWTRENKSKRAPHVIALIKSFNRTTYWVVTEIVSQNVMSKRKQRIQWFIELAQALQSIGNYNSLYAVIAGLEMNPVSRLKATWSGIGDKYLDIFHVLQEEIRPNQNYSNLRKAMKEAKPPILPYLGLYLRDLTFVDEGNPTYSESGKVNFEKLILVFEFISEIVKYQQRAQFIFRPVVPYQTFLTKGLVVVTDEDSLYSLSISNESIRTAATT